MQNAILTFQENQIRSFTDDKNEIWFLANDVCDILGYSNSRDAVSKHCKDKGVAKRDTPTKSGNQEMVYINEPNLYRLIIKSRKPEAEPFEQWVMEDVLPNIRKTGEYKTSAKRGRPRLTQKPEFPEHLRITRPIRNRDDLSFTKRDENGDLLNWYVPYDRENSWHENYGIGAIWFEEIAELAKHNPEEAYYAIKFSAPYVAHYVKLKESPHNGQASGFYHRMAVWTITGILANQGQEPQLPFQPVYMGKPPLEGFDYFLQKAAPRRELTPQEQYAIDQRARELANECHKLCYERRRYELMLQAV
ncbi:BRO-N domain-containing protein [Stenoxybacter acetivorans]|uniref:BRO-N domain-containing protein n=1 Tax=Stenoxybacter acetivorans TaxID=422441 RepID=UPI0009FEE580|nr:BRO family protein [Stenoxybacter acetivorans]